MSTRKIGSGRRNVRHKREKADTVSNTSHVSSVSKDSKGTNAISARKSKKQKLPSRTSQASSISDRLSQTKEVIGRRLSVLKENTARAFGISHYDKDFQYLQQMQLRRASFLGGQTRIERQTDEVLGNFVGRAHLNGSVRDAPSLDKNDIKMINEAFEEDLERFQRHAEPHKPDRPVVNFLAQEIDGGADIDEIALEMLQREESPTTRLYAHAFSNTPDVEARQPSQQADADEFAHRYSIGSPARVKPLNMSQYRPKPSLSFTRRVKSTKSAQRKASTITVYENYYGKEVTSKAGYQLRRFLSDIRKSKSFARREASQMAPTDWDSPFWVSDDVFTHFIDKLQGAPDKKPESEEPQILSFTTTEHMNLVHRSINNEELNSNEFFDNSDHKALPTNENPKQFLYNKAAWDHYETFRQIEISMIHELHNIKISRARHKLQKRKQEIKDALNAAKEHYSNNHETRSNRGVEERLNKISKIINRSTGTGEDDYDSQSAASSTGSKRFSLRMQQKEEAVVRSQLEKLRVYTPWFIYFVTMLQMIATAAIILLGGITQVGIVPTHSISQQESWSGLPWVEHYHHPNIWIGPHRDILTKLGAFYAVCVRTDYRLKLRLSSCWLLDTDRDLGCCELTGIGAGTTTADECYQIASENKIISYKWRNTTCAKRIIQDLEQDFEVHKFKPCCFGHTGDCALLSIGHCNLLNGIWHREGIEHCCQAHCIRVMCELLHLRSHEEEHRKDLGEKGKIIAADEDEEDRKMYDHNILDPIFPHEENLHYLEDHDISAEDSVEHNQIFRLFLSLFYHYGLTHLVLVGVIQIVLGGSVERVAGWLRIGAIYLICGYGGLVIGATLVPAEPVVGGGGAVSGLIAVHIVELIQSWKIVPAPGFALLKLLAVMMLMLITGTLPQINQYEQIGGFTLGIFSAVVFLPYISFNHWHLKARVIMIAVAALCIFLIVIISWILFYKVQPKVSGILQFIDCVPYTKRLCEDDD